MRRFAATALLLLVTVAAIAGSPAPARRVSPDVLARIADDDPSPLPRGLAPEEVGRPLPAPVPFSARTPPTGPVRTPSEYAPSAGLLVSWGSFNSLLTGLVVGVSTSSPPATAYVVVSSPSQQASATATLGGAGADMSRVEFLVYDTDSVWMRDYGPRFVIADGRRGMVDHVYNRPRPRDDAFPAFLAAQWGEPHYDLPLVHGGGNFHLVDTGAAWMSDLVLNENPQLDEADVAGLFAEYEGLAVDVVDGLPSSYDSTRHIDMWLLPVNDQTVIIGEYPLGDVEARAVTEAAAQDFQDLGYTVHRTPGWHTGGLWGTHYTYTNAVVFNQLVFTCEFNGYGTSNAAAAAVFETAFPDFDIIPLDCSDIISSAGALHCIVMHVPLEPPLFEDGFETGTADAWSSVGP